MLGFQAFSERSFSTVAPFTATVLPVGLAETLSFLDAQAGPIGTAASVAETVALADAQAGQLGAVISVAESMTLTDAAFADQAFYGLNFQGFSMMPFSTTSVFVLPVLPVNTFDFLTAADATAVSRTDWAPTQAEIVSVIDSSVGVTPFFCDSAEAITSADVFDGFRGQFGELADTIVFTVVDEVQVAFSPTTAEVFVLVDRPIGRGWFKVVDTQDPGWTLINNTQE